MQRTSARDWNPGMCHLQESDFEDHEVQVAFREAVADEAGVHVDLVALNSVRMPGPHIVNHLERRGLSPGTLELRLPPCQLA